MRHLPPESISIIAGSFRDAGLTNLEITLNSPSAAEIIRHLVHDLGDQLNIGAGTVCTPGDLETALSAGAQYIVTPIMVPDVIKRCVDLGIPIFPGACTPTEIYRAWSLGAPLVKVFPAAQPGPGYIKEILAPLPFLKLLPTGGIGLDNFPEFLSAGATGLGIGSSLFPKYLVDNGQWTALHRHFTDYVTQYQKLHP
jgi:2-dehydro-3-deoxyphosphogluconate aldolase/(4S)-4-hydroxy-2-oxoglutarate aldolase